MQEKNISLFFETSALDGQNIEMVKANTLNDDLKKDFDKAFKDAGNMLYLKYVESQLKNNALFDEIDRISLSNCERATITSTSTSSKNQKHSNCRC